MQKPLPNRSFFSAFFLIRTTALCGNALLEIKSKERVDERDIRDLARFLPDFPDAEAFCFSRDEVRKRIGEVLAVPWHAGLEELGL